ncbi:hypothetical protein Dalk_5235 [Desulfatibacillum aliphaticivorans]|uniref:Uncharacterized protein n=1 Tax=Desulfatibacillum aliphaticivorans TaxID=218208 RepID=B8FEC4_DESAL|nr:hypothetical protein Dalk_5235 [Desulfatibacillum aliphaticivorans]
MLHKDKKGPPYGFRGIWNYDKGRPWSYEVDGPRWVSLAEGEALLQKELADSVVFRTEHDPLTYW